MVAVGGNIPAETDTVDTPGAMDLMCTGAGMGKAEMKGDHVEINETLDRSGGSFE